MGVLCFWCIRHVVLVTHLATFKSENILLFLQGYNSDITHQVD